MDEDGGRVPADPLPGIGPDWMLTLVASALAGGGCIDDADALRAGRTSSVLGCMVKAPSTLGTFLRSFRWGHVRQLDRVSRELLVRAWAAGAGPGDGPLTIDLDSTICETYGLAKEGARHHGYTGKRGYHPLLAVAAGTGDVLLGHGIPDIVLVLLETELRSDFQRSARVTESPHELAVISQRIGFDNFQDTVQRPL